MTVATRRSALTWLVILAVPMALAALAMRAYVNEEAYATMERPSGLGSFVPEGYYDVVNREVAPLLAFCPTDIQNARILRPELAALQFQSATGQLPSSKRNVDPCAAHCETGRVSPLFCLRSEGLPPDEMRQIRRFILISPLKRDLHVLQRWRRAEAKGTDHAVALVHGERRQALPVGARDLGFRGRVLYRDSAPMRSLIDEVGNEYLFGGAGASPSTTDAFTDVDAPSTPHPRIESIPFARMLAARDAVIGGAAPQQTILRSGVLEVTLGSGELRVISPGGDAKQVIVEVPQQSTGEGSTLAASIDGADLGSHSKRRLVGLEDGQQLQLANASRTRALTLRFFRRQSAVLSGKRMGTRQRGRQHDQEAGMGRYLDALTGGISEAGRRLGQARTHCNKATAPVQQLLRSDIRLTLDQRLQHASQGALAHYAQVGPINSGPSIRRAQGGRYDGLWMRHEGRRKVLTPPPVMSLTILDANKGELLAMASYPSRRTLADMEAKIASAPVSQPGELLVQQLHRSAVSGSLQLKPHVIGSLFKPLMAWGFGVSDPSLLEVPVKRAHPQDWPKDPTKATTVQQCLVPKGVTKGGARRAQVTRFYSALRFRPMATGCGGRAVAGQDNADVCAAIGGSSTYWFLHLGARGMLKAMGLPFQPTKAKPNVYDALDQACAPRRHKGLKGETSTLCTAPKQGSSAAWFPTRCVNDDNPFCAVARLFDVQVQAIGGANPVTTGPAFLGPLYAQIDRLGEEMDERCIHVEQWRSERNNGLLWALPRAPQWPQDLMNACAHATMVIQGGFVNYWGSIALAQAMARVATGRRVRARLVREVVEPVVSGAPTGEARVRHVAKPKPMAVLGPARCKPGDLAPLCRVREGMRLAVRRPGGTLHGLWATEKKLNQEAKRHGLPVMTIRGKTGSGGEFRPRFVRRRRPGTTAKTWQTASGRTSSVHTALLVTFSHGSLERTFVVYLWAEGIDERFTSTTGAAPFFQSKGARPTRRTSRLTQDMPGLNVLRSLRAHVQAHWPQHRGAWRLPTSPTPRRSTTP